VRRRPEGVGKRGQADITLFIVTVVLVSFGILMVYSASSVKAAVQMGDSFYYLKRQLTWAVLGFASMLFVMQVDYWHWRKLAKPLLIATMVSLVLVLLLADPVSGSRRWLGVGALSFQPSEAIKLAMVLYLAHYLASKRHRIHDFKEGMLPIVVLLGAVFGLIMLQPDLGTAVALAGTSVVLLFVAGAKKRHLAALGAVGTPLLAYLIMAEEYRRRRFFAFIWPEEDPLGAGYQIIQSLYALGSGQIFGLGLGESRQKLFYLPEQHTDFIFAVIGEEFGFIGTLTVVLLYAIFAWRGYRIAITAPDLYSSLLATGVTTMIVLQAFVNMGVVTSLLPITGIPLPFISYGGNALLFSLTGVGILLNISRFSTG